MAHLASSALIFFTVGLFVAVFGQSGYVWDYIFSFAIYLMF